MELTQKRLHQISKPGYLSGEVAQKYTALRDIQAYSEVNRLVETDRLKLRVSNHSPRSHLPACSTAGLWGAGKVDAYLNSRHHRQPPHRSLCRFLPGQDQRGSAMLSQSLLPSGRFCTSNSCWKRAATLIPFFAMYASCGPSAIARPLKSPNTAPFPLSPLTCW